MPEPKELPSIEYLKECFTYQDGMLFWGNRPRSHFKTEKGFLSFTKQKAGKACSQILKEGSRYLTVNLTGFGSLKQHRIIYSLLLNRQLSPKEYVDHVDGDTCNNTLLNLRLVDLGQNAKNRKLSSSSSTGVNGVTRLVNKDCEFYRAQWWEGGKRKNKSYSISKYGEGLAFDMACNKRKEMVEKLGDYIER